MLRRGGLLLAFATVLLQLAVHLQPLLPEQYHIAPACHSLTHHLLTRALDDHSHEHNSNHAEQTLLEAWNLKQLLTAHHQHVHDPYHHHCQYCTVYGDIVLPLDLHVKAVLDRIQVRYLAFVENSSHVYFALQCLFLMPQGRAPPIALSL
ncbi:DUF2946 domain-containing protein [Acinetobacter sp. B51(2017)]|uniref:DUF2946 domain-containing protein n=1 Tax=Acinetobacter sp. B51(2017) TaxID=2060938 RepID=UPI000F078BEC|nr:DUF2946 domain-containing protein [Acinetobacter sp. B51(2017)]